MNGVVFVVEKRPFPFGAKGLANPTESETRRMSLLYAGTVHGPLSTCLGDIDYRSKSARVVGDERDVTHGQFISVKVSGADVQLENTITIYTQEVRECLVHM